MTYKLIYYLRLVKIYKFPIVLWLLVWLNINTGFWDIVAPDTLVSFINAFRALLPYIFFVFIFYFKRVGDINHRHNPAYWLTLYAYLALIGSFFSPSFGASFYFGLAFLMNLLIPNVFFNSKIVNNGRPEVVLLISTWVILALFVLIIYFVIGDKFNAGYGIDAQLDEVTRTSGLTRWFGVSGLICFAIIWQGKTMTRWLFVPPLVLCSWVVWSMQSRGGMFGFFAGVLFLLYFSRSSWRAYVIVFLMIIGLVGTDQSELLSLIHI